MGCRTKFLYRPFPVDKSLDTFKTAILVTIDAKI